VWEIEKNGNKIFLGGTFHILTPEDYPLPAAFEEAYSQSTQIVFETDIDKVSSPEFQRAMLRELTYTDGHNIQQVVSNSTYLALEEFFTARGIPMTSIVNFKPGMLVMTMLMVELQRLGLAGVGVDVYFNEKARNDRKKRGQLETAEEQVEFLANMGIGQEDEMLTYNLADIEKLPSMLQLLKTAWQNGDMPMHNETIVIPLKNEAPDLYQSMLVERNNAWMPQITALFESKEVEFVMVGALHMAGEDGLLTKLSAQGYKIRQLP